MADMRFAGGRPDIEKVREAYALFEEGMTRRQIAVTIGVNKDTVAKWVNDPGRFDPWLDEVAINRALSGDAKVYDNLTVFEYDEVVRRVGVIAVTLEPEYWLDYRRELEDRLGTRRWHNIERRTHSAKQALRASA